MLSEVANGILAEHQFVLGHGSESLALNADGALLRWEGRSADKGTACLPAPERFVMQVRFTSWPNQPRLRAGRAHFSFTYRWPEEPKIEVIVQHRLTRQAGL